MQIATPAAIASHFDGLDRDLSVETIVDERVFVELRREWDAVVGRAGVAYPFLSHDWLLTWWECFKRDAELRIVIVRSEGQIVAIAPLLLERARMYGMPVRRLRLLQNDHSPRADFIMADHVQPAYRAIWTALYRDRHDWDVLQLSQLPPDSPTVGALSDLAHADGCATGIWQSGSSPYLPIVGSEHEYFAALSAKFRQNLRNRMTRLTRVGKPELEIISDAGVDEALGDTVRLEASGWKREAGTAISADSQVSRFYGRLAERLAQRRWLRLMFLNVNGRRIATAYSIAYERRLFLCKTGYDPEYNTCSPFKLLMHLIVRYAYAERATEIDLLGDAEPWKEEWTDATRPHRWLFVFSDSHRARLLYPLKFQVVPAMKRTGVVGFLRHSEF